MKGKIVWRGRGGIPETSVLAVQYFFKPKMSLRNIIYYLKSTIFILRKIIYLEHYFHYVLQCNIFAKQTKTLIFYMSVFLMSEKSTFYLNS